MTQENLRNPEQQLARLHLHGINSGGLEFLEFIMRKCTDLHMEPWVKIVGRTIGEMKEQTKSLTKAIQEQDVKKFVRLIPPNMGERLPQMWREGKSPLHFAIEKDNSLFVHMMLKVNPAIVRAKDHKGRTPKEYAMETAGAEIAQLFSQKQKELETGRTAPLPPRKRRAPGRAI